MEILKDIVYIVYLLVKYLFSQLIFKCLFKMFTCSYIKTLFGWNWIYTTCRQIFPDSYTIQIFISRYQTIVYMSWLYTMIDRLCAPVTVTEWFFDMCPNIVNLHVKSTVVNRYTIIVYIAAFITGTSLFDAWNHYFPVHNGCVHLIQDFFPTGALSY